MLKEASFGELFGAAFAVGAGFHVVFIVLGVIWAFINPAAFHTTNAGVSTPADTPAEALGVLLLIAIFALVANVVVSAVGTTVVFVVRAPFRPSR
jgi:hypothetical protein